MSYVEEAQNFVKSITQNFMTMPQQKQAKAFDYVFDYQEKSKVDDFDDDKFIR